MKGKNEIDGVIKQAMNELEQQAGSKIKGLDIVGEDASSLTFFAAFENDKYMCGRIGLEPHKETYAMRIQGKFIDPQQFK